MNDNTQLMNEIKIAQALKTTTTFNTRYDNLIRYRSYVITPEIFDLINKETIDLFEHKFPTYTIEILATDLLLRRAILEIAEQIDNEYIILTNGCCNSLCCTTKKFHLCILEVLYNLQT